MFEFLYSLPIGRIAVSPHIRDHFEKSYNQETHNIFNGIDTNFFAPRLRATPNKTISILSSGNPFHRFKGKADIRKALNIIAKTHPHIKCNFTIVTGNKIDEEAFSWSGTNYELIMKLSLSRQQMRQAYYDSDIYVNSSWYEGFGLPSLEAMACGVPVIQSDNQGLTGIAIDKKNCLIVPPNNPEKMAEAIVRLVEDDALRNVLIKNGIETAKSFSKVNQYKMFVAEFEKILHCKFDEELVKAEKNRLQSGTIEDNVKKTKVNFRPTFAVRSGKSHEPFFSILVPTYNQAKYLPVALDSLINQTCRDWEAIVVDDGSTDRTPEVMKHYRAMDNRIRIFRKGNGGTASALNEGLRNARGPWICWLSSDDLFQPDKLSVHLRAIKENPNVGFFHTHYYVLVGAIHAIIPQQLDFKTYIPPVELEVLKFFERNYVNGISICIHHQIFDRVGYFNERYKDGQDFDMWLRITRNYKSHFIKHRTCVTRLHPEQTTNSFPLAGVYDSAIACLEFLNKYKFPIMFPCLDLSKAQQALFAIRNTLSVLANPFSFINRCGCGPALMDRLREWVSQSASMELKSIIKLELTETASAAQKTNVPEEVQVALQSVYESLGRPFQYKSYNPFTEMIRHSARLEQQGRIKEASTLKQYLGKISQRVRRRIPIVSQSGIMHYLVK